MRRVALAALAALFLVATTAPVWAAVRSTLEPGDVAALEFEQKLGTSIPTELVLRDEDGVTVPLRHFFHGAPVILVLEYLRCPGLCGLILGDLAAALDRVPL
ncbi:MAG: SCO family protein, partial [Alphaproteobacteria bacterium]|nr:SCO family protein [Alphaproteobacteria bacterium]